MRLIFEVGDKVKIKEDWRYWKKGDKAKVVDYQFERGITGNQFVKLEAETNKEAENDANLLYAYNVELVVN